jgi:hypothetical protein
MHTRGVAIVSGEAKDENSTLRPNDRSSVRNTVDRQTPEIRNFPSMLLPTYCYYYSTIGTLQGHYNSFTTTAPSSPKRRDGREESISSSNNFSIAEFMNSRHLQSFRECSRRLYPCTTAPA